MLTLLITHRQHKVTGSHGRPLTVPPLKTSLQLLVTLAILCLLSLTLQGGPLLIGILRAVVFLAT